MSGWVRYRGHITPNADRRWLAIALEYHDRDRSREFLGSRARNGPMDRQKLLALFLTFLMVGSMFAYGLAIF